MGRVLVMDWESGDARPTAIFDFGDPSDKVAFTTPMSDTARNTAGGKVGLAGASMKRSGRNYSPWHIFDRLAAADAEIVFVHPKTGLIRHIILGERGKTMYERLNGLER